jgi:flagellar FliJ protein
MQIRRLEDGVENLKYNMNVQKTVIAGQQQKVAKAREKLDHAMIERKTYEKLKENAFEEFKKEVNAEEQKEINELVSFRFGNSREREG